jgi:OOP family OmpA-OmpF porin
MRASRQIATAKGPTLGAHRSGNIMEATKPLAGLAIALALAACTTPPAQVASEVYEKVVFDATVLFDSDKSALRPAGRVALDRFVAEIHGLDSQSITATGYADRMGSAASNQILSEERVDAVKAYLVGKGIAADRVRTRALGETQPDTFRGECRDAGTPRNVACMPSDRHVFLQVSGTRSVR